jgi:hypothetical protein
VLQSVKISGPNSVTHPTQTPIYLSGVWLGVDPRTDTKNHHVFKRDQNLNPILGSTINVCADLR